MKTALALIYHDPRGGLYAQIQRVLPLLQEIFPIIAVHASPSAYPASLDLFTRSGVLVHRYAPEEIPSGPKLGKARRAAVQLSLDAGCDFLLSVDCDGALHWAEFYPQELREVSYQILANDLTVIGRTPRAFQSLPSPQRETEVIANHVFGLVSGRPWQITASPRGLSRHAAQAILDGCPDEEISTDTSWTLFLLRQPGFSSAYLEVEGLEFETYEKHAEAVAAAGGIKPWIASIENDPRQWLMRLELARIEIQAALTYPTQNQKTGGD